MDLPIIPCYEGKNCYDNYNCGKLCDYQYDQDISEIIPCSNGTDAYHGSCNGLNPNGCTGIQACCDTDISPEDLNCNNDTDIPTNGNGGGNREYLGCNILDNLDKTCDNNKPFCIEFDRIDDVYANCDKPCWVNGGYNIIKNKCELEIGNNENMCKAMEYFCDWDENKGICTIDNNNKLIPPYERHGTKYDTDSNTIFVRKDCTGLDINNDCIQNSNLRDDEENRYYVTTSRSSWDSSKKTSIHQNTRIVCAHDTKLNKKTCMTLPRCQFVENTQDCGSLELFNLKEDCSDVTKNELDPPCSDEVAKSSDLLFMCAQTNFNSIIDGEDYYKTGYCTWCKGTQTDKEFTLPQPRSQDLIDKDIGILPIIKDPIDWNNNSLNRCSNYNECEVQESEELWNKCIFDKSQGLYGVDYESSDFKNSTKERKHELLRTQGFCAMKNPDGTFENNHKQLIDDCTEELSNLGSINYGRVFGPNTETAACQYRYNWIHNCIQPSNPENNYIAENYLCTWCPSLQCKIGKINEICSEVDEENSWNGIPYCDTNKNFGEIINPKAPKDCDCWLPKLKQKNNPVLSNTEWTTILALDISLSVSFLAILSLSLI